MGAGGTARMNPTWCAVVDRKEFSEGAGGRLKVRSCKKDHCFFPFGTENAQYTCGWKKGD